MQAKATKKTSTQKRVTNNSNKKKSKKLDDFVTKSKKSVADSFAIDKRRSKKISVSDSGFTDTKVDFDKIVEAGLESDITGFSLITNGVGGKPKNKSSIKRTTPKRSSVKKISDIRPDLSVRKTKAHVASKKKIATPAENELASEKSERVAIYSTREKNTKTLPKNESKKAVKPNLNKDKKPRKNNKSDEKKITKKLKRSLFWSLLLLTFVVPIFVCGLIIHTHSKELFSTAVVSVLACVSFALLAFFIVVVCKYIKLRKSNKNELKLNVLTKVLLGLFALAYLTLCAKGINVLYGPDYSFRDWLITTAMRTKSHHYFATWFYSKQEINEVFKRNYIQESKESTDESALVVPEEISCSNEYDCAILEHEKDAKYKLITFDVNGCEARLVAIYDPSEVHVVTTEAVGSYGQFVEEMAIRENAYIAINGGGFVDPHFQSNGAFPRGIVIKDGELIVNNTYGYMSYGGLVGFNKDNKLVLMHDVTGEDALNVGVRDAVSWGPFLIVNGEAADVQGNGGWGYAARTAIGQRADGIVLFLVVDGSRGRFNGATMGDLVTIMQNYGAINASNMDGGTSSVMIENGVTISHPIDADMRELTRAVPTAWMGISKKAEALLETGL